MSKQLRRIGVLMLVLFAGLFVNLNYIQLVNADDLATHPANQRLLIEEYQIQRGPIVVGGTAVAHSEPTDGELKYRRRYEDTDLYSHLTGYYSFILGNSRTEAAYDAALQGTSTEVLAQNLGALLGGRDELGNTVTLTVDPHVQSIAEQALGDRIGAVVALDPTSGAVLASISNPSYDPNPLASHDPDEIDQAWDRYRSDPDRPLIDRVSSARYFPGSTFKLIVAAAALERGLQPETALPDQAVYDVPLTEADISNFSPGPCLGGGTISLADALRVSCNTAFAKLGVDLGAEALVDTAESFGYNQPLSYDLPAVESSIPPPSQLNQPQTAQTAIGQFSTQAVPLHQAMIVSAIYNDGVLLQPYVVDEVLDPSGRVLQGPSQGPWSAGDVDAQAISPQSAAQLQEMMVGVVSDGTGSAARIDGVRVGGKTGTAQVGAEGVTPTVWFVGFAEEQGRADPDAAANQVAVAVVIPDAGDGATGGAVAAPIAKAVMEAALGRR